MEYVLGILFTIWILGYLYHKFFHQPAKPEKIESEIKYYPVRRFGDIKRVLHMSLETVYLVCNSRSVDTVESRLPLFHDLLSELHMYELNSTLNHYLADAVAKYNGMYYDKPIVSEIYQFVKKPTQTLDNWDKFKETIS